MRRVGWVGHGFCAAWLCAAPAFAAEPTPTSYSLSWVRGEGAEECPAARTLATEIERRLGRPVFDPAAPRSFEVQVTHLAGKYQSDVFVRDEGGRVLGHRTLLSDEPGCGALFSATALAIALVIDPEAASRDSGGAAASFEAPPAPPLPAPAPPPTPVVVAPAPVPAPAPPAPTERPLTTVSVRGHVSAGLLPATAPGVGVSFTARPGRRFGFALSAAYSAPQTLRQGSADLDIGLTRATAALTFDVAQSRRARLLLVLGPSLGALHLAIREPAPVTDPGEFWFVAAELTADLQLAVSDVIFIEMAGAGLVPLRRQEFSVRDQAEPVWSQPWVSGTLHLGLGALFP